jgi:hypothetical protein
MSFHRDLQNGETRAKMRDEGFVLVGEEVESDTSRTDWSPWRSSDSSPGRSSVCVGVSNGATFPLMTEPDRAGLWVTSVSPYLSFSKKTVSFCTCSGEKTRDKPTRNQRDCHKRFWNEKIHTKISAP